MNNEKRKRITEAAILFHSAEVRYNGMGMMAVPSDAKAKEEQSIEYAIAAAN